MQFRNSLLSVKRSPLKSILFFILIFTLTVIVMLGSSLVYTCISTISQCRKDYITTAVLEYEGGAYPNQDVFDATARELQESLDFDALQKEPSVLQAQKTITAAVHIPGLRNNSADMAAANSVVIEITIDRFPEAYDEWVLGSVQRVLYANGIQKGRLVELAIPNLLNLGIEPKLGMHYLLCGSSDGRSTGNTTITVMDVLPAAARSLGIELASPIVELSSSDYSDSDPLYAPFFQLAEACRGINESRYAVIAPDVSILREFSQNEYLLKEGAFYTSSDCTDGTVCCLLPELVASRCELGIGDTVELELYSVSRYTITDAYWPTDPTIQSLTCLVTGIYGSDTEGVPRIYLSDGGTVQPGLTGFTLGTLRLENGTVTPPSLPPELTVIVYDQGYNGIAQALQELLNGSMWLLSLSVLVAIALLVLFAFLFISRQADALQTMRMLGTKRWALRRYVLYATGAVLLPAVVLACPVAGMFSGLLNQLFRSMTQADVTKTVFSTTGLSVIKPLNASVLMPWWLLLLCAGSILLAGLLFGLCFLFRALHEKKHRKKERKTVAPKERRSCLIKGAARKYVALSVFRGGLRSAMIPVLCLLLAVFLLLLGYTEQTYRYQRQRLDEDTSISGYFTDYSGKYRNNQVIPARMLDDMQRSELIQCFLIYQDSYLFSGGLYNDEGQQTVRDTVVVPGGEFTYENFMDNLGMGPKLIYTADLLLTGGFDREGKNSVTWLQGYDETYFTEEREVFTNLKEYSSGWGNYIVEKGYTFDEDLRAYCCVVPSRFLEENGLSLGDNIGLLLKSDENLRREVYKLIGSYEAKTASGMFYTRQDNKPQILTTSTNGRVFTDLVIFPDSYGGGVFTLLDTSRLQEAKEAFARMGYSAVRDSARYRVYPVFEDSEYLNSAEKLESNISFIQLLRIASTILAICAGMAAAFLMSARRKTELAILRSLGASKGKSFAIFFCEQFILCLLGTVAAVLLWRLMEPWSIRSIYAVSFAAGYLLATAFGLSRASRADLLTVLSEKE